MHWQKQGEFRYGRNCKHSEPGFISDCKSVVFLCSANFLPGSSHEKGMNVCVHICIMSTTIPLRNTNLGV